MSVRIGLQKIFFVLIVLSILQLGFSYATATSISTVENHSNNTKLSNQGFNSNNITVISTDSNSWLDSWREPSDGPRAKAELFALRSDGTTLYYNDSYAQYWDVEPVSGSKTTIEYLFAQPLSQSNCPDFLSQQYMKKQPYANSVNKSVWTTYTRNQPSSTNVCTKNGIAQVNLTTGESTIIYSTKTPGKHTTRWHDGDRINETHYAVADIFLDRIFIVDITDREIPWTWSAREAYNPKTTGGFYPGDWTHINDIEVLKDGRFMVSVRNHDRVVFITPGKGVDTAWTLGEEDNGKILFEQHNPDYIPVGNGGPAVIVADSENNRVIEYQRTKGKWKQTWYWRDARMQWPRDADRLPNGHTLIADSNGNRVFEVNGEGEVVWSVNVAFPYEVERFNTGDESQNGPSTLNVGIDQHKSPPTGQFWVMVKNFIPGNFLNVLMFFLPVWIGLPELLIILVGLIGLLGLVTTELHQRVISNRDEQRIEE